MPRRAANTGRQNWSNLATPNVYVRLVEKLTVRPNYDDRVSKIDRFSDLKELAAVRNLKNETIANITHYLQSESLQSQRQFRRSSFGDLDEVIHQIDLKNLFGTSRSRQLKVPSSLLLIYSLASVVCA